jgi:PAS domain-containing protein
MNSSQTLLTLSMFTLLGCACHVPVQATFEPTYPERNSDGDAIAAVFEGRIPCEVQGCDKRKVELVLYGREAGTIPTTYWLGQVSVGNDRHVQRGTWTTRRGLQQYQSGLVYVLDSNADPSLQYLWRVSDDVVLVLDRDLRPVAGNAAWGRMLSRDCTPYGPRTYPYDERTRQFVPESETRCTPPGTASHIGVRPRAGTSAGPASR